MNYAGIVSLIRQTAEAILSENGGTGLFHYGQTPQHAQEGYNGPMPQIHLDPLQDSVDFGRGNTRVPITIGFLDQDTGESNASQQAAIIDRMVSISDRFMVALSEEDLFDDILATRKPIYGYGQARLTGMTVSFTISTPVALC
ncbi:hypothetical protein [Rufibacter hautae]|uniref:DUF3168 domain-containing protein n=1 Tax=Rufibacter hautae TaxID=2595005 RepID=A0A5B6TE93_9BACT|nr:hypothetical protein [Rufibacter hautae]KAA3438486.1 hypothetical protein FOA19_14725 [Rufibacter hautae]